MQFSDTSRCVQAPEQTFDTNFTKTDAADEGFNRWSINDTAYANNMDDCSFLSVEKGKRYRMRMWNAIADIHPIYLHRQVLELTGIAGQKTAGVMKDIVMVGGYQTVKVDFVANNPGLTLFPCHQQLHMDFGFMTLFDYPVISASTSAVLRLQTITLVWMLVECGVALLAAARAHSPAMLAFGSDSLVELMSAVVVMLQFLPRFAMSERRAARAASLLLFALAALVTFISILALGLHAHPETSALGIGITIAALIMMPGLAWLKRREASRSNNSALAADAVQSATCAYLAGITLVGLTANATLHIFWFDAVAAIAAVPLLLREAHRAWQGNECGCC